MSQVVQIPAPSSSQFNSSVKQWIETRDGTSGPSGLKPESFVTVQDLYDPTFINSLNAYQYPVTKVNTDYGYTGDEDAPRPPTNLQITSEIFRNILTWDDPNSDNFWYIAVYRAKVPAGDAAPTVADAVKIASVPKTVESFVDTEVSITAYDHYYWIRAVSYAGAPSLWQDGYIEGHITVNAAVDEIMDTLKGADPDAWSSIVSYVADDRVLSGGKRYKCILANTNQEPPNTTYWEQSGILITGDVGGVSTVGIDGNLVVDDTILARCINVDDAFIGMTIQSTVFTPGSVGWQINKDGDVEFNGGAFRGATVWSDENDVLIISHLGGAAFSGGLSETGVIKITLPQSWTNTMMKFVVDIYERTAGQSFSLELSGYNYSPSTQWYYTTANLSGSIAANNRVRFGHDGTKCCIYIGEITSVWTRFKVSIRDFQAGHDNYAKDQWDDGWSISVTTSIGTVTSDISDSLIDSTATRYVNNVASTTLIVGGKIGTNLVTADSISVTNLSAISADVGTLTAGSITGITITGGTIRTSSGNQKVQLSGANNRLEVYDSTPSLIGRFGGTGDGNFMYINQPDTGTNYPPVYITSAQNTNVLNVRNTNSSSTYPAIYMTNNSSSDMAMFIYQTGNYYGVKIRTSSSYAPLYLQQTGTGKIIYTNIAGCYLTTAGVWTDASSKTLKENFEDIEVLEIIKNLDIKRYNYINERRQNEAEVRKRIVSNKKREAYISTHSSPKREDSDEDRIEYEKEELADTEIAEIEEQVVKESAQELERKVPKHFSPMAEDFYAAFGVGDCKGISAKDLAGIALQAVKELTQKVEAL